MTTAARRLLTLCLTLGLWAGLAVGVQARCEDWKPQPKPQNASRDIVGQELDVIIERGWIEFAVYEDYPPYSFEEGGQPRGVDIEVGRLIAEDLGVEPRFKFVAAGENLDADLRNTIWQGPVVGGAVSNVMLRVPYDSNFTCRVEQVVFTGQYAKESIAIAYRKDAYPEDKPVPAYFRFDTVAVENDSIADFYLTSLAGGQLNANIRRFPTMQQAMAALAAGEVKAAMGPRAQLDFGLTPDLEVHQPPLPGFSVGSWTVGVGVHFAYRPLGYAVDDAIAAALADGRIAAIFADYGLSFAPPER
ncbi:substrate-binding periplasmic protein [Maliponia aquimaris]|uniref:Bacterial extracellular solute-binding proteins, family 3 n=1 Tax=Maliponia aquimaris TaxID=1673631 RepID=A0A238JQ18_9RHOB|nr:transporter substrate-binding domain-containing protein [Maliponia aquimaris]SMX32778.1 Bacterial extracellular solute-binding proteins, family 3 [Maliponia aquimaris]